MDNEHDVIPLTEVISSPLDDDKRAPVEGALQDALDRPCDMHLQQVKGRFLLSIPRLGLLVSNKSLEAAYAEMHTLRERRIREFASEGLLHLLADQEGLPKSQQGACGLAAKLRPFFIKCAVVTVLFLGAMNILSHSLGDVGYVLEKKLQTVRYWTPEEIETQRAKSEQVAQHLGPVIRELMVMFKQPGEVPAASVDKPTAAMIAKTADNATDNATIGAADTATGKAVDKTVDKSPSSTGKPAGKPAGTHAKP